MRSDEGKDARGEFTCRIGVGVRKHINTCDKYESIVDGVQRMLDGAYLIPTITCRLRYALFTGPDGGSCHVNRNKINSVQWVDSLSSKAKKVINIYFLLPILLMSIVYHRPTLNPLCFYFL